MTTTRETDFSLSLDQLEGTAWGQPDEADTIMVQRLYALRGRPLATLTNDEVRLAVSQRVGVPFILDLALQRLDQDPLLDADCYPGDLLSALIRARDDLWEERPDLRLQLADLYANALAQPQEVTELFRESLGLPSIAGLPN